MPSGRQAKIKAPLYLLSFWHISAIFLMAADFIGCGFPFFYRDPGREFYYGCPVPPGGKCLLLMSVWEKTLLLVHKLRQILLEWHQKAWSGVSILVFKNNSAQEPRSHRINYYVLIFFSLLLLSIPVSALTLYIQDRIQRTANKNLAFEDRLVLLNNLRLITQEKRNLLEQAAVQVSRLKLVGSGEERSYLKQMRGKRDKREKTSGSTVVDQSSRDLLEARAVLAQSRDLWDMADYSFHTLRNRMIIHHMMPRNRPLRSFRGRITSTYGNRNNPFGIDLTGQSEFHGAYDLAARRGTPIIATGPGIVTKVSEKNGGGYGLYVEIHHGMGYNTIYAHCQKLLVGEGDLVERGQVIALVGNTGRTTGSHVHYEVRLGLERADPLDYMQLK